MHLRRDWSAPTVVSGMDPRAAVSDDRAVDDEDEFPAGSIEPPGSAGVRIPASNGWTIVMRTDVQTRLMTLDTEDINGTLVGTRVLGTDDVQRLVDALNEALERNRISGGPVILDVSQVIGRD